MNSENKQKLAAMQYLAKIYPHLYKVERQFDKETGAIVMVLYQYTNRLNGSLNPWEKKETIVFERPLVTFKWRTEEESTIPQQQKGYYELVSQKIDEEGLVQKTWHYRSKLVHGARAIQKKGKIATENIRYFDRKGVK